MWRERPFRRRLWRCEESFMGFFDWLFGKKESEFIPAEKGSDDFDEGKIAFIDE